MSGVKFAVHVNQLCCAVDGMQHVLLWSDCCINDFGETKLLKLSVLNHGSTNPHVSTIYKRKDILTNLLLLSMYRKVIKATSKAKDRLLLSYHNC